MAEQTVEYGIPAAVAMQHRVSRRVAETFARVFYGSFGRSPQIGGMVDAAITEVRLGLWPAVRKSQGEEWDWSIPVLFMRGDGELFSSSNPDASARAVSPSPTVAPPAAMPSADPSPTAQPASATPLQAEVISTLIDMLQRGSGGKSGPDVNITIGQLNTQNTQLGAMEGAMESKGMEFQGDVSIGGDLTGGDKIGGDKVGGDKVQAGGDAFVGDDVDVDQSVTYNGQQFAADLESILTLLRAAPIDDPNGQEAVIALTQAKEAAAADAPQEEVRSKFDQAAGLLEKAEGVVEKGSNLGKLLLKAAKIVGTVIAWL
jgi:hypothetical protein